MSNTRLDLSNELSGRRALVTGGSRGIGAAIARRLLDGGATVVVTARAKHASTPKDATFVEGDVRSLAGTQAVATAALRILGGVDIVINNAGAARAYFKGADTIPDHEWLDALQVNYLSAVRISSALLPALRVSKAGVIVNISSGGASSLPAPLLHYCAAKAALNAYSKGLAQEVAAAGIRVNVVTPGPVVSPGGDEIRKTLAESMSLPPEAFLANIPLRRLGEAHEVAELVALLVSDRGRWMTSANFFIDGGMSAL